MQNANPQKKRLSPDAVDRDIKVELAYVFVSVATFIGLAVSGLILWAVLWLMATFFMFGVWRTGRTTFR